MITTTLSNFTEALSSTRTVLDIFNRASYNVYSYESDNINRSLNKLVTDFNNLINTCKRYRAPQKNKE